MLKLNRSFILDRESIDEISEMVNETCKSLKMSGKNISALRFSVEESLLTWFDKSESGTEVRLKTGRIFGKPYLSVSLKAGTPINPFADNSENIFGEIISTAQLMTPDFSYKNGESTLTYYLRRKEKNPLVTLFSVVAIGIFVGFLGKAVIPDKIMEIINDGFLSPTYDAFLNALRCIAGPLIFFSVAWGIYGIGDKATLNKLGKGMIFRYILRVFAVAVLCCLTIPFFSLITSGDDFDFSQVSSIYKMLLDIIPSTIIQPFESGNTIQIIVFSSVVGVALLFLGKKTTSVALAIKQINYIVTFLMEFISRLVPYFIVIVLVTMIWSGNIGIITDSWKFMVIFIAAALLNGLGCVALTAVKNGVSPFLLMKKAFPSYIIALTTASSAASFATIREACEKRFGIKGSVADFGVPLGFVICKGATAANYLIMSLYFAEVYAHEVSLSWVVMAVIISAVTAIATPPIPGGGTIAYTLLLSQLGLPADALAVALALDMFTDFIMTSTDMFSLHFALTDIADRYGFVDKKVLTEKN